MELQRRLALFHHRHPRPGRGDGEANRIGVMGCRRLPTGRDPARPLRGTATRWVAEFVGDINLFEGELPRATIIA